VPTALACAASLEAFYTDLAGNVGLGRWMAAARHFLPFRSQLERLHHRELAPAIRQRTSSFGGSIAVDTVARRVLGEKWGTRGLDRTLASRGLKTANLVYSSLGWGRPLFAEAQRRGIPVVTEFYLRPSMWKTYQAEFRAFPGWEDDMPFKGIDAVPNSAHFDPCAESDFVIVPTSGVADDVADSHSFPKERISVVPYGVDESFFGVQNRPTIGRVLFAGTCCLGKGIHYLAMASERLADQGYHYEYRIAGNVTPLIRSQAACRYLNFLDRIPRSQFKCELETTDLLVFPTLSDSFGMVMLEAMAAGIPVICSPYCADLVDHGVNGLVVEPRDVKALAGAIAQIVEDRGLRDRIAAAARERARDYTWPRYSERLLKALDQIFTSHN
jgi:glycosyltransferase involved in cell wall biosynthesis